MPLFSFLLLRISQDSDSHAESQLMSVTSALGLDFGHLVLWSPVKDRPMARVFTGSRATVTEFSSWDEFPKSVCSVGHLTKQISLMFRGGLLTRDPSISLQGGVEGERPRAYLVGVHVPHGTDRQSWQLSNQMWFLTRWIKDPPFRACL